VTCPFHLTNFLLMSEQDQKAGQTNNSSLAATPDVPATVANAHAADIIRNFTLFYPPDVAKEALWQLLAASMSGNCADDWNGHERSNLLLFYRLAGELVEVLPGLLPHHND
jgi:hypothetical protein